MNKSLYFPGDDLPSPEPASAAIEDKVNDGTFLGCPKGTVGVLKPTIVGPCRFVRLVRRIFGLKTTYDIT